MKKVSLFSLLLALCLGFLQAQTYNLTVSGTVTDLNTGAPIANHPVDVAIDSNIVAFTYFNTVTTDMNGDYSDVIAVPNGLTQGNGYIYTRDCNPNSYQYLNFTFSSGAPTAANLDFQVCDSLTFFCQSSLAAVNGPAGDVDFTATGSGSASVAGYWYDFGDGTPAVYGSGAITHNYALSGTYYPCVTAIFMDSCSAISCTNVTVSNGTGCQAGYFWYPDSSGQYSIVVVDQSVGTNLSYLWDFGDGGTSTSATPSHTYNGPGTYVVCVTITSQTPSCTSTYCDSLVVVNKIATPFSINVVSGTATAVEPKVDATLEVNLYPNPAQNFFQVEMGLENEAAVVITLMDLSGKVVLAHNAGELSPGGHSVRVRTQDLAAGLYVARIQAGDATTNVKVMISK